MASNMYGTTVACRMCYRDQYGTPVPRDVACLAKKPEARRWGYGYHLISRICQWKPRGSKSADGSLLGHGGCDVRCYSCGSHNSCECETEECDAVEGGASPYSGITRLNERACQDAAVLGLGFLKLDARARKDTQKIDHTVKERAARLNHFARAFKERAQSDLKKAADKHWSDGALEADLRRADLVVKRRAMEDAFMALKFVQDIHDMMEAYQSMASAFSEADGIDYTDPEERLAQDPNYAVARAASSAIDELKKQWELEEGDSLSGTGGAGSEREELSVDPHGGQHGRNGGGVAQAPVAGSGVEHGLDLGPPRLEVLLKVDKDSIEVCRTRQQRGKYPPLIKVFDFEQGPTQAHGEMLYYDYNGYEHADPTHTFL
ncbi:hypothetical protein SORBI_3005G206300 [Sorghum bicolor]|uniref:Uncharacterized protein n=1 Tax=Sorghum bicolor TaxID=4558 RepID=A0A1Z5RK54_SORBI|nr:hypothetical protein SORBI_3005G206300 [Sorghum bicolor]